MARTWKPHKPWKEYGLRICKTLHSCAICKQHINCGEKYYDGGYNLRAHEGCVEKDKLSATKGE